jgi:hypothetical protein
MLTASQTSQLSRLNPQVSLLAGNFDFIWYKNLYFNLRSTEPV